MEEEPRTETIGNEGKKRLVVSEGGFSVYRGGGIVVAGVIFLGGVIATAAFSFLSRRRRDSSGNRDGEISVDKDDDEEEEEEELKKDFGIGSDKDMDQNLLRFDLIISSPIRLNHFGGIKETKLVTCIFRDGSSSYATVDDSAAVLEERFFWRPDKKNRLEFNRRNDDEEEFPLLLPNILQNGTDGDQEIKKFKIPILNSGNIEEVPFQAAIGEDNTMFIEAGVVENGEELDQDGDIAGPHVVSEITETEARLDSVVEDQIQEYGSKLDDCESNSVILICEESHENGNHDQMLHDDDQDQPKNDLIPGLADICDEEVPEEKFVKMQQAMYNLSKFNNDWIPEKELQKGINISDKSSVNSSLIGRYTLQLAELSEKTKSSSRRRVLVFTVMVLCGSLQPWYCSRPFPYLLLMHFRNYVMVKLHIMYRNHGRNHLKYRLVPKMFGI